MKTLSIVIVTYNGRDVTLQALGHYARAIVADPAHCYEVIVVDNASADGVADAVAAHYPQVHLIRNSENWGFARASNIGYEASHGRYILFSNADVELAEGTLPTLISLMDEHSDVGACTPFLELVGTGGIDWGAHRGFPTPWAAFTYFSKLAALCRGSKRLSRVFGQYHLLDRDLTREHEVDVIRGGFFFVRREVFERAGRWDEDYFMYGEDIDLCFQIKALGHKIMFYPQARVLHHHGLVTGLKRHSQSAFTRDLEVRERVYNSFYDTMKTFYDKHYRDRYSAFVRRLIFLAIDAKKWLGRRKMIV